MSFAIGDKAGDYEITGVLGSGGMGTVYKVRNLHTDRFEAMKVILPNMTHEPQLAERFQREIRVQASLEHPNIATLRTAFRIDNRLLMVMELVEGETLDDILARGPMEISQGVACIRQALEALAYAHERGVIHRDIKPGNIMVRPDGTAKLLDFGIARAQVDLKLTSTGMALGSPYYMAPEVLKSVSTDLRSDLYSIGIVLYEIVTGTRPIGGDGPYAIMMGHLTTAPAPPEQVNPKVSPSLSRAILKAIAKEPGDRFQTAQEFREELGRSLTGQSSLPAAPVPPVRPSVPPPSHSRVWVGGAVAVLAVLAAGITVWRQRPAAVAPGVTSQEAPKPEAPRVSRPEVPPPAPKSAPVREQRAPGSTQPSTPVPVLTLPPPSELPPAAVAPPAVSTLPPERPRAEPAKPQAAIAQPAAPPPQPDPRALMEEEWARAGATSDPAVLDAFRRKYPQSPHATQAAARIEQLERDSARNEVLGVLRRYQTAFAGRDLDSVRRLWPRLTREQLRSIEETFKITRSLEMRLLPAGDPQIHGDSASVSCQRTLTTHFQGENRPRKPVEHRVVIQLKKSASGWVIESIE